MVEMDGFLAWLGEKGFSAEQLAGYRALAIELGKHADVDTAVRAAEAAGAPPKRVANLQAVAARITEYERSRAAQVGDGGRVGPVEAASSFDIDARDRGALERAPVQPTTDVAPARPAPRVALQREHHPPRLGCECRERKDVYLDTDFGALASMIGGGVGIGTLILIRFFGLLGAAAIALGLAACGGAATIISICFRCEGCRRTVRDLDDDEKAHLRKGRGKVTLVTLGFVAGAALCSFFWWRLATADLREKYPSMNAPREESSPAANDTQGESAGDN